jgi:WD40 repeat protein
MIRLLAPLCIVAALTLVGDDTTPAQSTAGTNARLDAFGDPLPDGAFARLGTTRFRHGGKDLLGFTADGKALMFLGSGAIHLIDPLSGKEAKTVKTEASGSRGGRRRFGSDSSVSISADGKVAAVATQMGNSSISVIDVETGKERKRFGPNEIFKNGQQFYQTSIHLSADGQFLVVSAGGGGQFGNQVPLAWVDTITGSRVHEIAAPQNGSFSSGQMSKDGKEVVAIEQNNQNGMRRLMAFDAVTGKELRALAAGNNSLMRFQLRPDGKTLLGNDGGNGALRLCDFTGKELKEIRTYGGTDGGSFILSRDGQQMFVAVAGFVQHWDIDGGKEIRRFEAPNLGGSDQRFGPGMQTSTNSLALSADGKTLAASGSQSFMVFDSATGQKRAGSSGGAGIAVVRFTPDGKDLIVGNSNYVVQDWDVKSAKLNRTFERPEKAAPPAQRGFDLFSAFLDNAAFSADGKLLAAGQGASGVGVWDVATGKFRKLYGAEEGKENIGNPEMIPTSFAFAPRGNVLATGLASGNVKLWDATTGEALRSWGWAPGGAVNGRPDAGVLSLTFSPDGKTLAGGVMSGLNDGFAPQITVILWETATGKERLRLHGEVPGMSDNEIGMIFTLLDQMALSVQFSPDGKSLMIGTFTGVHIVDAGTGKDIMSYSGRMVFGKSAAFSRDGKLLFVGKVDGTLRVVDAATGRTLRDFPGHTEPIYGINLSPDGTMLATGSNDSTVLLWEISELSKPASAHKVVPTAQELNALWNDLAGEDGAKAYKAINVLASTGDDTVALLRQHIKPVAPADPKVVEQHLEDLNSQKFGVREKANAELEHLGDLAALALQKRLQANPTLEMRQRMEKLVAKLNAPVQSPEMLQTLRGIETLERIATAEAALALGEIAKGADGHRVTEDARAALHRLERQAKKQ